MMLVIGALLAVGCSSAEEPSGADTSTIEEPAPGVTPSTAQVADGEATVEGACAGCHEISRIFIQPEYTDWDAVVKRMQEAHAVVLTDEEVANVSAFLESRNPTDVEKLISVRCVGCHELANLYEQPADADWGAIVDRMITQNGAQMTTQERDAMVKYLSGE